MKRSTIPIHYEWERVSAQNQNQVWGFFAKISPVQCDPISNIIYDLRDRNSSKGAMWQFLDCNGAHKLWTNPKCSTEATKFADVSKHLEGQAPQSVTQMWRQQYTNSCQSPSATQSPKFWSYVHCRAQKVTHACLVLHTTISHARCLCNYVPFVCNVVTPLG